MSMLKLATVAAAVFGPAAVSACTAAASTGSGNSGAVSIDYTDIPANLPPTPAPVPPPPPPPIKQGWLPAPPRPDVRDMTRQSCSKEIKFVADASDITLVQEKFIYKCRYEIFVEVYLFPSVEGEICSCGGHLERPVAQDPNHKEDYVTEITDFSVVVYDTAYKKAIKRIHAFDSMSPQNSTSTSLEEDLTNGAVRAIQTDMNFSETVTGFTGTVDDIDQADLDLLDVSNPANQNHVAAMAFKVEDTYTTEYRWPEPSVPVMSAFPNTYFTNCIPWYPSWGGRHQSVAGDGTAKRFNQLVEDAGQVYWFRDFYLFSQQLGGAAAGVSKPSRYLTSYYMSSTCNRQNAMVTFDRDFTMEISRSGASESGAFSWSRTYGQTRLIGGVPTSVDGEAFMYQGHHSVEWTESNVKNEDQTTDNVGALLVGKLARYINGTPGVAVDTEWAPINDKDTGIYKLCESVPANWFTCSEVVNGDADNADLSCYFESSRYLEEAYYLEAGAGLDCTESLGYVPSCNDGQPRYTSLAFQNFGTGSLSRDFSKKAESHMLTGHRAAICGNTEAPDQLGFDTIAYRPFESGQTLANKRSALSNKRSAEPRFNYKRQDDIVSISLQSDEPLFGHPEAENLFVKPAAGSSDANGKGVGDHPVSLFPETYTVPVSLDPNDLEYTGVKNGFVFSGTFSPCLTGTIGCTCRDRPGRPACDEPMECSDQGYCVAKPCTPGSPGCDCIDGNTCSEDNYKCDTESLSCVYEKTCNLGETGCGCAAGDSCNDASSTCYGDVCIAFDCPAGMPGCECGESDFCHFSTCDSQANVCKFDTQTAAQNGLLGAGCGADEECLSPGASCHADAKVCVGERCAAGKSGCRCNAGACEESLDECSKLDICVTATCEPGSGGCQCFEGSACASGFECKNALSGKQGLDSNDRADRCVVARCAPGTAGCVCDPNAGDNACSRQGFKCINLLAQGEEYRCVAKGDECGDQVPRCVAFCGQGLVEKCPGCSNQVPICKTTSGSSLLSMSAAALLLAIAAMMQF